MAYDSRVLRIFIASPSDVLAERQSIAKVIQEWNDAHSYGTKTVLLPLRWETHSAPDLKDTAQNIINEVVDQCDFAVGAFWTRIGSSTGKAISGTVEEIERVRAANKPVMLYFSKAQLPTDADLGQVQKVRDYKASLSTAGLYWEYQTIVEFETAFKRHLNIKVNELIAAAPPMPQAPSDVEKIMTSAVGIFQAWAEEQKAKEVIPQVDVEALTEELRHKLEAEITEKAAYNHEAYIADVKKLIAKNGFPDQTVTAVHKNVLIKDTVFDFVLESSNRVYLVLIRAYDDHYQNQITSNQLSKSTNNIFPNDFPAEIAVGQKEIQPLIIAPSNIRFLGRQSHHIPILKYIIKDDTFKNWDDILELLEGE